MCTFITQTEAKSLVLHTQNLKIPVFIFVFHPKIYLWTQALHKEILLWHKTNNDKDIHALGTLYVSSCPNYSWD